jgi:hypothetical protein
MKRRQEPFGLSRVLPTPRPLGRVYKAAPRERVWATPLFLHNGSVPNPYEMLVRHRIENRRMHFSCHSHRVPTTPEGENA